MKKHRLDNLPATMYVTYNADQEIHFAYPWPDPFDNGEIVGVYELRRVTTKQVTHALAGETRADGKARRSRSRRAARKAAR
jgi:hypothetical protein